MRKTMLTAAALLGLVLGLQARAAVQVDLTTSATVEATATEGKPIVGGFDGNGNAYATRDLGSAVTWAGTTFNLPPPDKPNATTSKTIDLPPGNYTTLQLLAAGAHGQQLNQKFTVAYTDGSTVSTTQNVSDWWGPQNFPGETKVVSSAHLDATGKFQIGAVSLYGYTLYLDVTKTAKSLTLPANKNVTLLAAVLTAPPPPITATITVAWTPPTTNVDGSPLTDLTNYNVYMGAAQNNLLLAGTANTGTTTFTTNPLNTGTYYFEVTAVNSSRQESARSATVSGTVSKPISPPGAPSGVTLTVNPSN